MKNILRIAAPALALTVLPWLAPPALAQTADAEYRALLKERKVAEAEALARERAAKNPKDDVALWYLARLSANDAKKREEAIPRLEQCVKDIPLSARCHGALATLYAAQALTAGMLNGLKYASRIKELYVTAVELDPRSFDARRDLNQFYLQAPGIAGGSVRKAIDNAESLAKLNPAHGQLLRAEIHVYEKEFDKAEAILTALKPSGDELIAQSLPNAWAALGYALINDKQHGRALALFERQIAQDGGNATLHYGLGRAQFESNALDAAIASFERVLKLDAKFFVAHYRLGIAWQSKGDKPRALAALQQFLATSPMGKTGDDARQRLETLRKNSTSL